MPDEKTGGGEGLKKRALAALTALCLLAGCAPRAGEASPYAPAPEDRLTVYTSHKWEVYAPLVQEFEERTGLWVEVVTGGTNELLEQIAAEAEDPRCDVMFGGGVESLAAYAHCFEPYTCAQADKLKADFREGEDLWTPFSVLPLVLIYNTKLLSQGQVSGWGDLLDSKWKGKIALADPNVSGSSYTAVLTMLQCLPGDDWDLLERLVDNLDGKVLADSGDVVSAVSGGSCYLGVTLEETALKQQALGAEIAIVYPREGTSAVPDGSALIRGAAHRENGELFLDFVVSENTQRRVAEEFSRRSVRTDVEGADGRVPESELGLIEYDLTWAGELKGEFALRWEGLQKEGAA